MAWLQQEDTDLTYLQVDSFELPKQKQEGPFKSLAPLTSELFSRETLG